jgi:hypothetical protein
LCILCICSNHGVLRVCQHEYEAEPKFARLNWVKLEHYWKSFFEQFLN